MGAYGVLGGEKTVVELRVPSPALQGVATRLMHRRAQRPVAHESWCFRGRMGFVRIPFRLPSVADVWLVLVSLTSSVTSREASTAPACCDALRRKHAVNGSAAAPGFAKPTLERVASAAVCTFNAAPPAPRPQQVSGSFRILFEEYGLPFDKPEMQTKSRRASAFGGVSPQLCRVAQKRDA